MNLFWFRRDLRLNDNHGLYEALKSGKEVLALFIFDTSILGKLKSDDRRVPYIHREILKIDQQLREFGSRIIVRHGEPSEVISRLIREFSIDAIYANQDYEPYGIKRDSEISDLLNREGKKLFLFNDHLIFKPGEVLKPDGTTYTVFTSFSKKWLANFNVDKLVRYPSESYFHKFVVSDAINQETEIPSLQKLGFNSEEIHYPEAIIPLEKVINYADTRDYPAIDATTKLGMALRFGTISIRECVDIAASNSNIWLNELIWREFFMHILFYYPDVVDHSFKKQYDKIRWINDEGHFRKWCEGKTGYPLVDAGMRQMIKTGFMHNRVRMVTASFLVKHLLIDWRWGEAFFAEQLLDYELSSNNGNWQWAAGSGCDAAPYFRIFNPMRQQERFDPTFAYIRKWVPEYGTPLYPAPVVNHEFARKRCLEAFSIVSK